MKNSLLLSVMLMASYSSFAQNAPIDFEPGGNGANWTWTVFENADNPALEIIANPDPSGMNTSATVAKFTARENGESYAGCESDKNADLGPFVLDATNSTIKIMVWKSVISDVGIKLASPMGWAQVEIKVPNTLINQWEEITFNFSSYLNPPVDQGQLSQIIIFPDFNNRNQDNVVFFDNITFSAAGVSNDVPLVAAPTPTQLPENVISMFSDAYTDVTVDTWRTDWSAATLEDVLIEGNATKKYSNLDFAGIETVNNQLDITEMTYLHVDVWSSNFTMFGIKLVDFGPNGVFDGGGDDVEHQVDITMPAQGQWVSLNIPLNQFTGLTTRANLAQYILVGQPTGATTVYIDNMFFYKGGETPSGPTSAAPTPTVPSERVISLFSDAYTDVPVDTWRTDWSAAILEDVMIAGNATKKYSNLDFVGIETIANQLNITNMTHFHLDVWSSDFTLFGVKLVDFGPDGAYDGGDDTEHQIDIMAPAQGEWVSLDIPLADFVGLTSRENLAQYILVGQPTGATTVYVDNMYFYTTVTNINKLDNNAIAIYPNPVKAGNEVRLNVDVNQIELFDITGKLISTFRNSVINTSGLNEGIYFARILTQNGKLITQKLVIN
jgi:hypothetical protein